MKTSAITLFSFAVATLIGCSNVGNTNSDPLRNHQSLKKDRPILTRKKSEGPQDRCDFWYQQKLVVDGSTAPLRFTLDKEDRYSVAINTNYPNLFSGANAITLIKPPEGMRLAFEGGKWFIVWKPLAGRFGKDELKSGINVDAFIVPNQVSDCLTANMPVNFKVQLFGSEQQASVQLSGLSQAPINIDGQNVKFEVVAIDPTLAAGAKISALTFDYPAVPRERQSVDLKEAIKNCRESTFINAITVKFECEIDNATIKAKNSNKFGLAMAYLSVSVKSSKGTASPVQTEELFFQMPAKPAAQVVPPTPPKKRTTKTNVVKKPKTADLSKSVKPGART